MRSVRMEYIFTLIIGYILIDQTESLRVITCSRDSCNVNLECPQPEKIALERSIAHTFDRRDACTNESICSIENIDGYSLDFKPLPPEQFQRCEFRSNCSLTQQQIPSKKGNTSTFSVVKYKCIKDDVILKNVGQTITGSKASLRYDEDNGQLSNVECTVRSIGEVHFTILHALITSNISNDLLVNNTDEKSMCRLSITDARNETKYCLKDGEKMYLRYFSRKPEITVKLRKLQADDIVWLLFEGKDNATLNLSCSNIDPVATTTPSPPITNKEMTTRLSAAVTTTPSKPTSSTTVHSGNKEDTSITSGKVNATLNLPYSNIYPVATTTPSSPITNQAKTTRLSAVVTTTPSKPTSATTVHSGNKEDVSITSIFLGNLKYILGGIVGLVVLVVIVTIACIVKRKTRMKAPDSDAQMTNMGDNSMEDDTDTYNHFGDLEQETTRPSPNYNHVVPGRNQSPTSDDTYDHFPDSNTNNTISIDETTYDHVPNNKSNQAISIDATTYDHVPGNRAFHEDSSDTYHNVRQEKKDETPVSDTYDHL